MDEEFESFIVDPDLVDPELDISGLRTATNTRPELLFDLPEFSGIRVDPTRGSYIEDMYRAYAGQIPMLDVETPAAAPPATGGGGSGDGGPGTTPTTTPTTTDNTFIGGGATLEDAGGTAPGGGYATDYYGDTDTFDTTPPDSSINIEGTETFTAPTFEGDVTYTIPVSETTPDLKPIEDLPIAQEPLDIPTKDVGLAYTGEFDPDDEGTVFDTSITPKDTEESITQKIANYLNVDTDKLNKAAVTSALNLVAGKALDTVIPIATVFNLVKDVFVKSPEKPSDTSDTTTITGVNPFADIDTGVGEFDTTPPVDEFSDEEFMVGDTSTAAPTTGDSGADSFFDAVDSGGVDAGTADVQDFADIQPEEPSLPTYGPPSQSGGGGNGGSSGGGKSIVCTAMYQTTGLEDWSKAMKIWYIYQKKYLTIEHQEGYHKLFKPFVKGMHKSSIIKAIGAHVARHRTQHLKHVMFNSKSSLLGKIYNKILEPICYWVGRHG